MADFTFASLRAKAEEAGISFEPLPEGRYDETVIEQARYSVDQKGRGQFGFMFRVLSGPCARRTIWMNQLVLVDNPKSLAVMFRVLGKLGISEAHLDNLGPAEAAKVAVGQRWSIDVEHNKSSDGTKVFENVKLGSGGPPSAAPAAPVAPAPAWSPPAAEVPAAPVAGDLTVTPEVPVSTASPLPAPAVSLADLTPEQLAALTAQLNPAAAAPAKPF